MVLLVLLRGARWGGEGDTAFLNRNTHARAHAREWTYSRVLIGLRCGRAGTRWAPRPAKGAAARPHPKGPQGAPPKFIEDPATAICASLILQVDPWTLRCCIWTHTHTHTHREVRAGLEL
uniref:Uncharacterized protein n=1 Tax=Eutreptiella gymnastica TaxID=73025 RepID=A0A7S1J0T8_9EUGL